MQEEQIHRTGTQPTDHFEEDVTTGRQAYRDAVADGHTLQTQEDVWALLEECLSPQAIQQDEIASQKYHISTLSLPARVGFVVGYLTAAFSTPGTAQGQE